MSKEVNVIFVKDLKGKAKLGEVKKVKLGFARNYLVPQGIALTVTKENLSLTTGLIKKEEVVKAKEKKESDALKAVIDKKAITTEHKTHDEGKLYGSVGASDIQSLIKIELEVEVDKKYIDLKQPIREVGTYTIPIELPQEVACSIELTVAAKED